MAILNEKLLLYKVTGYIKHCVTHGKYCIPLGQSGSGSMIEDHSDHSASIGTAKSTLDLDSSVAMIRHDPSSGRSGGGGGGGGCAYPAGISFYCNFVLPKIREGPCHRSSTTK